MTLGPAYRTVRSLNGTVTGTSYRSGDGLRSGSTSFGWDSVTSRTVPDANGASSVTAVAPDVTSTLSLITKAGLEQTAQFLTAAPATVVASTSTIKNPLGRS